MFQFPTFAPHISLYEIPVRQVGFPIRIPVLHLSLSHPHGFSQSAASFFARYRQGIHQMPLSFNRMHIINT